MYKYYNTLWCSPGGYARQFLRIMKILFILMTAFLVQVSASTYAQKIILKEREAPLTSIFEKINKQSGIDFLVSNNVLDIAKLVSIDVKNEELATVLDKIFEGQPLDYEVKDKAVIVRKKTPSFLDRVIERIMAIDVRGRVVDEKGEPLAGATIRVKGTNQAVTANAKGEFFIQNVDESATLIVSYLGYATKELQAAEEIGVIKLAMESSDLQEVTINKGYYKESERLSTGSVSHISGETISKQPVLNPLQAMQGRMAGVNIIQATGVPGGGFQVSIRGRNGIRSDGNDPLYIIDGIPFSSTIANDQTVSGSILSLGGGNPLSNINPSDIESIDVLKDAGSTAIYGSRGANGVILITTRRARKDNGDVNINFSKGISELAKKMRLLNRDEYLTMRFEALKNDGISQPRDVDYDINGVWGNNGYTDWQDELLGRSAGLTNLNALISGGVEKVRYSVGANYKSEGTVFPGDFKFERKGASFSLSNKLLNDKLTVDFNSNYSKSNSNLPKVDPTTDALRLSPLGPSIFRDNGELNFAENTFKNPLTSFINTYNGSPENLITNSILTYSPIPSFSASVAFGFNNYNLDEISKTKIASMNPAIEFRSGVSEVATGKIQTVNFEPQINYNLNLGNNSISVLLGSTFNSIESDSKTILAYGYTSDALLDILSASSGSFITNESSAKYRYVGLFSRVNYSYFEKYVVNLTARIDGSSRFGPDKKFGNFGSLSTAWLFSREKFLADSKILSFGKLWISYGTAGSDNIGNYEYLSTYGTTQTYNGNPGLTPQRLFNANYGWESNVKLDLGLDLGFVNDRFTIGLNYFNNNSFNQLVGNPVSAVSGFDIINGNFPATVRNSGYEIELGSRILNSNNVRWNTSFNMSILENKVTNFPNIDQTNYRGKIEVGERVDLLPSLISKGVNPQTGVYEFYDLNGNDVQMENPADYRLTRTSYQKYFGGFNNSISFRQFQLDVFTQFVNQVGFNPRGLFLAPGAVSSEFGNQPVQVMRRWQEPGDVTDIQRFTSPSEDYAVFIANTRQSGNSDKRYIDASYIRLKSVQLAYSFSKANWLGNKHLKIFLQGQNLITFSKYEGLDPESALLSSPTLPPLRTLMSGISLNFN